MELSKSTWDKSVMLSAKLDISKSYEIIAKTAGNQNDLVLQALRLYGNLYGEESVTENLYNIFPIAAPLIMNVLSLLFCLIQALVFTMLLSLYVAEAAEEEE